MTNSELKSKVVSLGNRLAGNMPRGEAFAKAWGIVKAGAVEIRVAGVTYSNRQEALRRLSKYQPSQIMAFLVPEPNNPIDRNAVAVMVGVQGGKGLYRLGYVPRNMLSVVTAIGGKLPALRVVSGAWGWAGKTTYGARVALAV